MPSLICYLLEMQVLGLGLLGFLPFLVCFKESTAAEKDVGIEF